MGSRLGSCLPSLQVQEKEDAFKQTKIDALFGAAVVSGGRGSVPTASCVGGAGSRGGRRQAAAGAC